MTEAKDGGTDHRTDPPSVRNATERRSEPERRSEDTASDLLWNRLLAVTVGVMVVVGIILRFVPRSGLWLDEALSVNISSLPLRDIPGALRHDGHPPLYYVLLHFWTGIFGHSDWAVRAMSGVISTLTLPAMYLAARRLASRPGSQLGDPRRVGSLAMGVVAVMPFAVRYGAETRMYALVILLATLGYPVVCGLLEDPRAVALSRDDPGGRRAVDVSNPTEEPTDAEDARGTRDRIRSIIAAAALTAALLWTHYWTIWLLGAVGIMAVTTIWIRRNRSDSRARSGPADLLIAMVIGGLAFLPWLPTMAYQAAHTGTPWGEKFGPFSTAVITLVDFSGGRFGAAQFLSYILVILIVAAALLSVRVHASLDKGLGNGSDSQGHVSDPGPLGSTHDLVVAPRSVRRIRPELTVAILTMILGWLTARLSGNTYSSRYGSVVFPLFILVVGAGLALIRRPRTATVATALVALLCLYGSVGSALADRTQVGRLVDAIETDMVEHPGSGDMTIIVCPDQLAVATQRQVDQRPALRAVSGDVASFPVSVDPRFVDWVDYADRNAAASTTQFVDDVNASIPSDATLYLINNPHYRTLEGKCEAIIDGLAHGRSSEVLKSLDTSGLDESAQLRVFRPLTSDS